MKAMTTKVITITAILALTGCAQMKGSSKKVNERALRAQVGGSMASPYGECSRGLFKALIYKDFANEDGAPFVTAKGVMTKEALSGVSANYLLGDEQLIRGKDAPKIDADKFMDLGNVVQINLGLKPSSAAMAGTDEAPTANELRTQLGLIAEGDRESSPLLAIDLIKKNNIFMGDAKLDQQLVERASDDSADASGVGQVRSMLLRNNGLIKVLNNRASVADLPADVGNDDHTFMEAAPKVGTPMVISVAAATPAVSSTWFTVVISDPSDAPKSAYIYRIADKGQDTLKIPTAWTGSGGNVSMSPMKSAWIRVNRSQMTATEVEGGGKFCVETATGVLLSGSIEEAKKQ